MKNKEMTTKIRIKQSSYAAVMGILIYACAPAVQEKESAQAEPEYLTSWNDVDSRQAIIDFVEATTTEGSPDYIEPEDRIATFDNDGTLWSEQPFYFQLQFGIDRAKELSDEHPEWASDEVMSAATEGDLEKLLSFGTEGILKVIMLTHGGLTEEEFDAAVMNWVNTARHPKTNLRYNEMVYQPMLEVLDYLRAHGYKTYIVSGGGIDFMRPWTQAVYGIPEEQVVGSSLKATFEERDGKFVVVKSPEMNFVDDKAGKPVAIHQHIGKRPVMAFGNSDGDLEMMQYSSSRAGKSLQVYVHHTDAEREWSYDRDSHIGALDKGWDYALENGWVIVDMAKDWKKVYPSTN
ncbi:HAD family hydrolase [Algoriphagus namhaensis]